MHIWLLAIYMAWPAVPFFLFDENFTRSKMWGPAWFCAYLELYRKLDHKEG